MCPEFFFLLIVQWTVAIFMFIFPKLPSSLFSETKNGLSFRFYTSICCENMLCLHLKMIILHYCVLGGKYTNTSRNVQMWTTVSKGFFVIFYELAGSTNITSRCYIQTICWGNLTTYTYLFWHPLNYRCLWTHLVYEHMHWM